MQGLVFLLPQGECGRFLRPQHGLRGRSATRGGRKPHCGALFSGKIERYSGWRENQCTQLPRNPKRSPRSRVTSRSRGAPVPPRHYTQIEALEVSCAMGAGKPARCGSGGSCATEQPNGCLAWGWLGGRGMNYVMDSTTSMYKHLYRARCSKAILDTCSLIVDLDVATSSTM